MKAAFSALLQDERNVRYCAGRCRACEKSEGSVSSGCMYLDKGVLGMLPLAMQENLLEQKCEGISTKK